MGAEDVDRGAAFESALLAEWTKALAHAGIAADRAHLWFGREPHDEACGAKYFLPVMDLGDGHGLDEPQLTDAHSDEKRALHRVVVYPEYDFKGKPDRVPEETVVPLFGALLRHELQHALQQEACGNDVLELDDIVNEVLLAKLDNLPGGSAFYNMKPIEQDANDAASIYLREHHAGVVATILDQPSAQLARSLGGPEDAATLMKRTVCFLYTHRDVCQRWAGETPFSSYLFSIDRDAAALWRQLNSQN